MDHYGCGQLWEYRYDSLYDPMLAWFKVYETVKLPRVPSGPAPGALLPPPPPPA
jgi:hypothetical protein